MGRASCNLGYVARFRGDDGTALRYLQDAAVVYRELNDPWQLAGLLVELAAQLAAMGRGAEALQALAESAQLDDQIGQLPEGSFRLGVAAVVHAASERPALAATALGAYDAHVPASTGWWHPGVNRGELGWLAKAVEETRGRLDPAEVADAKSAACDKSVGALIDELIIRPANATD